MKRPTYTPASYIKKVFRLGERSLPKDEIIGRLNQWLTKTEQTADSERLLQEILSMSQGPIRVGSSEAIIEFTYQPHQLFDLAYRYVRDTHAPKTVEQILREVRRQTQFSWNQASRLLVLEKDPRFVQYEGDSRWFLAEWKLMNDQIFDWVASKEVEYVSLRNLYYFVEQELGLQQKEYIFLPELDDRFKLVGDNLFLVHSEGPKEPEEPKEQIEMTFAEAEIAATIQQENNLLNMFEEETHMNTTQVQANVKQEVTQHLRQALALLEMRNQEMAQEVIINFQQSNIQAIEVLMNEKHKNEQALIGISQVLAQYDQQ